MTMLIYQAVCAFLKTTQTLAAFSQGQLDFDKPMKRDVVKKFYRNAQKERVEITAKSNNGK